MSVCIHISQCATSLSIYIFHFFSPIISYTDFCMYIHISFRGKSFHVCMHISSFYLHHVMYIFLYAYTYLFVRQVVLYKKFYDSIFTILYTDFCVYLHIALRGKSFHICIYTHFIIIIIFIVLYTYFI